MEEQVARDRLKQLVVLAEQQKIDWKTRTRGIPETDLRLRLSALATLLRVSVVDAWDEGLSVQDIIDRAKKLTEAGPQQ